MSSECVLSSAADSSSVMLVGERSTPSVTVRQQSSSSSSSSSNNDDCQVDTPDCPSSAVNPEIHIDMIGDSRAIRDGGSNGNNSGDSAEDADRLTIDEDVDPAPARHREMSAAAGGGDDVDHMSCDSPTTLTTSPTASDESPDSSTHPRGHDNRRPISCQMNSQASFFQGPGPSTSSRASTASKGILKRRLQPEMGDDSDDSSSSCSSPVLPGEIAGQNFNEGPPCKVPRTRRLNFKDVTVYYFPRTQGFTCVPSQGGATLGMSTSHSHVKTFSLTDHEREQRRIHTRILRERRRMRALQQRQLQLMKEREFQHRMKLLVEASSQQHQQAKQQIIAAGGVGPIGNNGGEENRIIVPGAGHLQESMVQPPHLGMGGSSLTLTAPSNDSQQKPTAINESAVPGPSTGDGPSTSQPRQQIPGISTSSNNAEQETEGDISAVADAKNQQANDVDSEETEPAEEDEEGAVVEVFPIIGGGQGEESEEEEEEEDGEEEEDPWGDGSEEEVDDSYFFLQPVPSKRRRVLLKAAGVDDIDSEEKEECKSIRSSREYCGCSCQGVCLPETCLCSKAGITCQVDRMNFPCGCNRLGCQNPAGRIEFNPARVRNHFLRTLMRLEMEDTQAKYLETLQKTSSSSHPASKENAQPSEQPRQLRQTAPTRVNTSCFMQSLARQVANSEDCAGESSSSAGLMEPAGPSAAAAAAAMALNTLAFKAIMHHQQQQQPSLDWSHFHQFPGAPLPAAGPSCNSSAANQRTAAHAQGENKSNTLVNFIVGDPGSDDDNDDEEEDGGETDTRNKNTKTADPQGTGSASNSSSSSPLGSSESADSFQERRTPLFGDFSVSTPGGIAGSLGHQHQHQHQQQSLDFASIFGDPQQLHHHLNQFHHEVQEAGQVHRQHLAGLFNNSAGEGNSSFGSSESFFAPITQPLAIINTQKVPDGQCNSGVDGQLVPFNHTNEEQTETTDNANREDASQQSLNHPRDEGNSRVAAINNGPKSGDDDDEDRQEGNHECEDETSSNSGEDFGELIKKSIVETVSA